MKDYIILNSTMYTRCIQWRPDYPKDPKVATPLNLKQYCELKTNIRKVCQEDDKDTPQSLSIVIKNKSQNLCFESTILLQSQLWGCCYLWVFRIAKCHLPVRLHFVHFRAVTIDDIWLARTRLYITASIEGLTAWMSPVSPLSFCRPLGRWYWGYWVRLHFDSIHQP